MGQYVVTLSPEEEKALLTDMGSIEEWISSAAHNKARQRIDKVCEEVLGDQTDTVLTRQEKQTIASKLAATGQIIGTVKQMPEAIKNEIVRLARVKSALERQAEAEEVQNTSQI